jgi:hypothetical protein
VYLLAEKLTNNRRIAWFSVLIFAPHLIHTFPTYDTAFTPELLFTLFYIGATLLYVRYLRTGTRSALFGSIALFVGGLLSKETAIALPFTLLAVWFLLPREKRDRVWSLLPYFAILGLYLVTAIGYLHIRQLDVHDFLQVTTIGSGDYAFGPGRHILTNLATSLSWVFGIPEGHWTFETPRMLQTLEWLRILAGAGVIGLLFTSRRRFILIGVAWFLTTAGPAYSLVAHFLPYYMFAPLVGFALVMGITLDWAYVQAAKIRPHLPMAAMIAPLVVLAVWTVVHVTTGRAIAANHALLGAAARVSGTTIREIRSLYPTLSEGTHVVLFNEDIPQAPRDQGGVLLQLAYNDPSLTMHYVTEGFSIPQADVSEGKVLALKWMDGEIVDITAFACQRPELLVSHPPSTNYHLEISTEAEVDGHFYTVRVPELPGTTAAILYAIDGVVMEPIQVKLDEQGEATLDGYLTKRGTYTFVAVRSSAEAAWVPVARSIRVTAGVSSES